MKKYTPNPYAIIEVPFMRVMYRGCYPLALLLDYLGFSPNLITTISNLVAVISIYFLIYSNNPFLFPVLWILSLVFDVCDGLVARMTNKKSANGGFYDKFSDQIKFLLVFYAIAIKYDNTNIWIVTFIVTSAWLLSTALSNESSYLQLKLENIKKEFLNKKKETITEQRTEKANGTNSIVSSLRNNKMFWSVYSFLFVLYGNANFLIIPISFGKEIALYTLIIFSLIVFKNVVQYLFSILRLNREIKYFNTKNI